MPILTQQPDLVVGVDTHTDTHTAVALDCAGRHLGEVTVATDEDGYGQLLDFALAHAPGPQVLFALEGTGSHGRGLCWFLTDLDQPVVEVEHPKRSHRKAKSDPLDAHAAARRALAAEHHIEPRRRGPREQLRLLKVAYDQNVRARTRLVNQLKAALLTAPHSLRDRLRDATTIEQAKACRQLRVRSSDDAETVTRIQVLRDLATQIHDLDTRIKTGHAELDRLTRRHAEPLRDELGVGPVSGAQILISWSHPGRFRSHAALATFAGTAPITASSGRNHKHRLSRLGDRQLNNAIHTVIRYRLNHDPETQRYFERRTTEGKTAREATRCLKRHLTRRLFKLLETLPDPLDGT